MPGRVLIIDDDETMRHILEAELSQRGFRASSRASGDEGLALLATEDFDVVLTDVNMPGMTGVDLCHRIVSNREDLPVVVMTAFGNVETAVLAIRAGAYDFVTKPFEMEDLVLTLDRAFKHRALRQEVKRLR